MTTKEVRTTKTEFVSLSGGEVEVARIAATRPGLPTLVFLHEGLGSIALWRDFPAALAAATGCGALFYSRYGNGFSAALDLPRTPRYMHGEALVVLPQLLETLGIDDVAIVGHSDGASIALVYASEHPVRGLLLEAPHLFVEDISVQSIAAIGTEYQTTTLRDRMARYHADGDRTFYGWNDIWLAPEFRDWNIESEAARVRAPILAIQGLDDRYGTLAQVERLAAITAGPTDRLLLAGCGHTPHRDRPAIVLAAAAGWMAAIQ